MKSSIRVFLLIWISLLGNTAIAQSQTFPPALTEPGVALKSLPCAADFVNFGQPLSSTLVAGPVVNVPAPMATAQFKTFFAVLVPAGTPIGNPPTSIYNPLTRRDVHGSTPVSIGYKCTGGLSLALTIAGDYYKIGLGAQGLPVLGPISGVYEVPATCTGGGCPAMLIAATPTPTPMPCTFDAQHSYSLTVNNTTLSVSIVSQSSATAIFKSSAGQIQMWQLVAENKAPHSIAVTETGNGTCTETFAGATISNVNTANDEVTIAFGSTNR